MRQKRVPVMMNDVELAAIDDWRWQNRIATRSAAIRQLCSKGVADVVSINAMQEAERFIRGFEDDEMQEGITDLLAKLRSAITRAGGDAT